MQIIKTENILALGFGIAVSLLISSVVFFNMALKEDTVRVITQEELVNTYQTSTSTN